MNLARIKSLRILPSVYKIEEFAEHGGKELSVRAVLGHFILVYIHPYLDGNGRIGRFLFNTMLASGGYLWTITPMGKRDEYMLALERASVGQNINDFSKLLNNFLKEKNDELD